MQLFNKSIFICFSEIFYNVLRDFLKVLIIYQVPQKYIDMFFLFLYKIFGSLETSLGKRTSG